MPHQGLIKAASLRFPHKGCLTEAASLRLSNVGYLYEASSPRLPHWGFLIKAASLKLPHSACFTEASLLRLPHWGLLTEAASLRLPYWGCLTEASLRRFPHCNPLVETSSLKLPHWRCHILTSSTGFLNLAVSLGLPHQFSLTMVKHGWCCRHGQRNPLMLMWYAVLFCYGYCMFILKCTRTLELKQYKQTIKNCIYCFFCRIICRSLALVLKL